MSCKTFVGCQASSKTTANIAEGTKWLDVLGGRGLFINSTIDTRDMINVISSNSSSYKGLSDKFDAYKVERLFDIKSIVNLDSYDVICIDEIQFFPDLEEFVKYLLDKEKHIICSGLDSDWLGNDFGQVKELLKLSTEFIKLSAKCLWCTEEIKYKNIRYIPDACRTGKLISGFKQIDAGGNDKYVPLCLQHHRIHLKEIHGLDPNNIIIPSQSKQNSPKIEPNDNELQGDNNDVESEIFIKKFC